MCLDSLTRGPLKPAEKVVCMHNGLCKLRLLSYSILYEIGLFQQPPLGTRLNDKFSRDIDRWTYRLVMFGEHD